MSYEKHLEPTDTRRYTYTLEEAEEYLERMHHSEGELGTRRGELDTGEYELSLELAGERSRNGYSLTKRYLDALAANIGPIKQQKTGDKF